MVFHINAERVCLETAFADNQLLARFFASCMFDLGALFR
jgi:hypothetical protein